VVEGQKKPSPAKPSTRSEAGASRGDSGSKADGKPDPAAVGSVDLEDYLTERREKIDRTYDYRYSQLTLVFGKPLCETGWERKSYAACGRTS